MKSKLDNLIAVICVILAGCFSHPKYLETKYFCQRKIDIAEDKTNVCIRISGLCGHSSLGVDQPEKSMCGDTLSIEFPLRPGALGTIKEMICIPNHINKVKLAGELIWKRKCFNEY